MIAVSRSKPIHGNPRKDPYIIGPSSRIVVVAASFYWSSLGKSFVEVVLFVPHVCGSSRKDPYIIGPSSWIVIVAASFYWSSLGKSFIEVVLFVPCVCGSLPSLAVWKNICTWGEPGNEATKTHEWTFLASC